MRVVGLGHWLYFVWHLPTVALGLGAMALVLVMGRSLWRDQLPPGGRQLRWTILGWSASAAALLSVIVWPYLVAVAGIRVAPDGAWQLTNYLGLPLANIPAREVRRIRVDDLGGLHLGSGHIVLVRADGEVYSSVRVSGPVFERARRTLGYTDAMVRDRGLYLEIPPHVFSPGGPVTLGTPGSRDTALASRGPG